MRLIDADAFEVISYQDTETFSDSFDNGVLYMLEKIDNAPTVDAVPVVRCKDCKYQGYCMRRIPFFGRNLILELNIAEYHPLGFCSYGERRTDGT